MYTITLVFGVLRYIYRRYVYVGAIYRHVRSVYLETAVSARESKFIDLPDSSKHPSLLCSDISVPSRGGTELESPLNIQCRSTQYLPILFGVRMKYRRPNSDKIPRIEL